VSLAVRGVVAVAGDLAAVVERGGVGELEAGPSGDEAVEIVERPAAKLPLSERDII
jgi:hypothetical protein